MSAVPSLATPRRGGTPGGLVAALLGLALSTPACLSAYPQRAPGPILLEEEPTPPQHVRPDAPLVTVQRSSDPVWVRQPGERGDVLLPFYRKRERVPVGCLVRTGAGGRAELLWAPDASALALFDEGRVTVGDPERDEPMLRFHSVTHARLTLTPEDRVVLVGGSLLAGDPLETTGPVLLQACPGSVLRVLNHSKRVCTIAFRSERLELGPGESIDLPLLGSGATPYDPPPGVARLEGPGFGLEVEGQVERDDSEGRVALRAQEPTRVTALGVAVDLESGETVGFSGLTQVHPRAPADASGRSAAVPPE